MTLFLEIDPADELQERPLSQFSNAQTKVLPGMGKYIVAVKVNGELMSSCTVLAINGADAICTMLQHMQRDDGLAIPFMTVTAGAMK